MLAALLSLFFMDEEKSQTIAPLHPNQRFQRLCARIARNDKGIKVLSFHDEKIDIRQLARSLTKNTNLQDLEFIQSIQKDDIEILCWQGVRLNRSLRSLTLSRSPVEATWIQKSLQHHPTLKRVCLSRCQLMDTGLFELCISPLAKIQELDLSHNYLTSSAALHRVLEQNIGLENLSLCCNNMCGLEIFASTGFRTLQTLNLSANCIGAEGGNNLGKALAVSGCALKKLQLNQNPLGYNGLTGLADGLCINKSLEKLELRQCSIGDEAATYLAQLLRNNYSLIDIRLGTNSISTQGALALLGTSLRRLELSRNHIQGGEALVKVLATTNVNLEYFNVRRNKIPARCERNIRFWMRVNASGCRLLLLDADAPVGLWADVLANASEHPDVLQYLLIRKPELCLLGS